MEIICDKLFLRIVERLSLKCFQCELVLKLFTIIISKTKNTRVTELQQKIFKCFNNIYLLTSRPPHPLFRSGHQHLKWYKKE